MDGYKVIHDRVELKPYLRLLDQLSLKGANKKRHRHHIVPKAMGGGDELNNLIALNIPDHVKVHKLLAKCLAKTEFTVFHSKMAYAASKMGGAGYGTVKKKKKKRVKKRTNYTGSKPIIKKTKREILVINANLVETIKQKDAEIDSLLEQLADACKTPEDIDKELDIQQLYKIS